MPCPAVIRKRQRSDSALQIVVAIAAPMIAMALCANPSAAEPAVILIGNDDTAAAVACAAQQEQKDESTTVVIRKTEKGVRFGVLGGRPARPAPTLFVFAHEIAGTLTSNDYNKVGRLLAKSGVLCVALDLPCHGENVHAGEPAGLEGWAARLRKNEDFVADFTKQASAVLDQLVADGFTDRDRIAVCGTSRGGFMALHFAAAEPRVRCVAAFAPVTELSALREFDGMEKHAGTNALDLRRRAGQLAGRPVWMCIGNLDERVDTDRAIAFSREVVKASAAAKKQPLIELHVMTSAGHTIHPTAHDEAAAWVASQLK